MVRTLACRRLACLSRKHDESICIDETAPSNGELYTIVSNRSSHGGKGTIIAIVNGVAADVVTEALMRIDEDKRLMVKEITMDI